MADRTPRPQTRKLREVVEYLESIGLHVYGPNVDLDTRKKGPALRDFSAQEVLWYRRILEEGGFHD